MWALRSLLGLRCAAGRTMSQGQARRPRPPNGKSRPPSESKRQPSGLRLEASLWKNGLASPKGDLQICSEVGNSRGRVQAPDCPLPAFGQRTLVGDSYGVAKNRT